MGLAWSMWASRGGLGLFHRKSVCDLPSWYSLLLFVLPAGPNYLLTFYLILHCICL